MTGKLICTPEKRKQQVVDLLKELNLPYEFIGENQIKIFGRNLIYGKFLATGHVHLEKESSRFNRRVQKWTCEGMKAINSYLRQHALELS